jgi:hypothetical protein
MNPASDEGPEQTRGQSLQPPVKQLIESSSQALADASASAAESAFGIGCSLGALLGGSVLLVAFLLGMRHWTSLAILTLVAALVSVGVSTMLSGRARNATLRSTYERQVRPQIERFRKEHGLSEAEFAALARPLIPENAPLRAYLPPGKTGDESAEEEA